MRAFFTFLSAAKLTAGVWAQSPQKMSYQAVIRNNSDQLVTNQPIGMRVSILHGSVSGSVEYTEIIVTTSNVNGLVSIEIGGGAGFEVIDWSNGLFFIKTETDPLGGTNYTITNTSQLLSVPYALHAKTAETLTGGIAEKDPVFTVAPAYGIDHTDISNWSTAYGWGNHANAGYLTYFTESDPVFVSSAAKGISATLITNWNTAFNWGNHAAEGYLKSFTESDPNFEASPAKEISATYITNWNTAFDWGNHATAGYLKSFAEADPIFETSPAKGISSDNITNWNTAFGWRNHANAGYLKSFTETDPIFEASSAKGISLNNISNWNTTYSWGNHDTAGYMKSFTEVDPVFGTSAAKTITETNIAEWNNKQNKLVAGKNINITSDTISAAGLPAEGTTPGEMLYWNGSAWVVVAPGTYGKVLYFCNGVPTWGGCASLLTTTAASLITATTATSGGNISSDGGSPVTARGVCWDMSTNPTTDNSYTTDGIGTGVFVSRISGLIPDTLYYIRAYATNNSGTSYGNEVSFTTLSGSGFTCGSSITINHTAGSVAPVTKTVTYGTVTNIPGESSKCWISQNLGADHQATSVDDDTEASAGWYWQFNRKQGYKHDGITRTPDITWISSINENSDWTSYADPCTNELGSGWRIPTYSEWIILIDEENWTDWNSSWSSELKLHTAGYLYYENGLFDGHGAFGSYWSSSQSSDCVNSYNLYFDRGANSVFSNSKSYGFSVRCIK